MNSLKALLFLLSYWSIIASISAQSEFAPIGAEWHYSLDNGYDPPYSNYLYQEAVKDTLISDTLCRKVHWIRYTNNEDVFSGNEYYFVKSDSLFYYNSLFQRFHLLFDYSASVGDTVHFPAPIDWHPYRLVIDSIKTINIAGQLLRQYYTTALNAWLYKSPFIEKIGASESLLPFPDLDSIPVVGTIYSPELRCYEDSIISLRLVDMDCDTWITSNLLEEPTKLNIEVWPQPASTTLHVKGWKKLRGGTYNIIGLDGQKLRSMGRSCDLCPR